ncbi:hypothetical protein KAH37_02120 [bacterium]|nr:hypothetical protein [bacterium]
MKLLFFWLLFFFVFSIHGKEEAPAVLEPSVALHSEVSIVLPEGIDAKLAGSSLNWLAKDINRVMITAIQAKKVQIKKVDDFLYAQVIPNFAYLSEDGEERLGTDLMTILDSGVLHIPGAVEIMQLNWNDLKKMKLPFKRSLATRTIFPSEMMTLHLDITFFINLNRLTKRLFEMLKSNPLVTPVYNSQQKFYRAEIKNSKLIYMFRIPNIAYEVAYTATPLQNIVGKKMKEISFLASLMKQFESRFTASKGISWDGRYLKNKKGGMIDMWFLAAKSKRSETKAAKMIEDLLAGKMVSITGSEK